MTVKQKLTPKMTFDLVLKGCIGSHQKEVGERISGIENKDWKKLRNRRVWINKICFVPIIPISSSYNGTLQFLKRKLLLLILHLCVFSRSGAKHVSQIWKTKSIISPNWWVNNWELSNMSNLFFFDMFTKNSLLSALGFPVFTIICLEEAIMQSQSMKITQHKTEPKDNAKLKVDLHFWTAR